MRSTLKISRLLSLLALAWTSPCLWLIRGGTELISAPDPATPRSATAAGNSLTPVFSGDGRFLVFTSEASNLVTNDHNGAKLDVFVKELATGKITLASVTSNGESGNGDSYSPSISSNGQWVAFLSRATNLVNNDTNGVTDVYVRDLLAGQSTLISAAPDGAPADDESFQPLLTPDGQYVCFGSRASNLVSNHGRGKIDVFVRNLQSGRTELATDQPGGHTILDVDVQDYGLSDDGHWVVFTTLATNIVAETSSGVLTTGYLHDRVTGRNSRFTLDDRGGQSRTSPVPVRWFSISPDSQHLAVTTEGFLLNVGQTSFASGGTYLFDLVHGTNFWLGPAMDTVSRQSVSIDASFSVDGKILVFEAVDTGGARRGTLVLNIRSADGEMRQLTSPATGNTLPAEQFTLSPDGKRIAFISKDSGLLPNVDTTNEFQLYVFDLPSNTLRLINAGADGKPVSGVEFASPQISPDGLLLAFQSRSAAFVANDRNAAEDIFLYDWETDRTTLVSAAVPSDTVGSASHGSSFVARGVSHDGRYVLFTSMADDLVPGDENGLADLFVRDRLARRTERVNVNSDGSSLDELIVREAALAGNGRFVAFIAERHTRDRNQIHATSKVYARDLGLGETRLVSVNTNGLPGSGQPSQVSISADGRFVAFLSSDARDLVPGIAGPVATVVRDLELGKMMVVEPEDLSVPVAGAPAALSGLGGKVFSTLAARSVPRGFILDATTGERTEVAVPLRGIPLLSYDGTRAAVFTTDRGIEWSDFPFRDWHSIAAPADLIASPSLSADGRFAVFASQSRAGGAADLMLLELVSGQISRLNVRPDGQPSSGTIWDQSTLDAGAHTALFRSDGNDLVPGEVTHVPQIFIRDLVAKQTALASLGRDGLPANDFSSRPLINTDAGLLIFSSWADNLVAGDLNLAGDIFAVELPPRPFADSDGDGMDDLWELTYFGNLARDGKADFDEDGVADAAEFAAGTSPIGRLRMTARIEATTVMLTWTTELGQKYQLRVRESFETPWQPSGEVIRGDGAPARQVISLRDAGQRFYQVTTLP